MEILEAYCIELRRNVDIYDAQDAYFAVPENRRKRFTFGCSDEACRAEMNPLVSGVNYDKLCEETEKYRQPHFRAPKGHPHSDRCIWVHGYSDAPTLDHGNEEDFDQRIEHAKATNVIDVFRPKTSDPLNEPILGGPVSKPVQKEMPHTTSAPDSDDQARDGYSSTSRLERFIDCWTQFAGDELKQYQVEIEGHTFSYRQAVLRPNWITPAEIGTRVIYGGSKMHYWPDQGPRRLYINFMDECEKLPEHRGSRSLAIDLPLSRIRAYRGMGRLLQRIEQAQKTGYYAKVYCWGSIKPREKHPGYSIEIASLDNLVIKAIAKGAAS